MDIENEMSEYRKQKEIERQNFFKKCANKIRSGELIYQALSLYIAKRYEIDTDFMLPEVVYIILNHYFDNVEEDFETWINKENSPLLRESSQLKKIFPEIYEITKNERKIVEIANEIYGLNLHYHKDYLDTGYIYSFEFDFNTFIPIDINKIKELKEEIRILEKYNIDTSDLRKELLTFGLTEEQIKLL